MQRESRMLICVLIRLAGAEQKPSGALPSEPAEPAGPARLAVSARAAQVCGKLYEKPQKTKAGAPEDSTHTLFDLSRLGHSYTPHQALL